MTVKDAWNRLENNAISFNVAYEMANLIQGLICLLKEDDLSQLKDAMNSELGYLLFHSKLFIGIDSQMKEEAINGQTQFTGEAVAQMFYMNIESFKELANFRGEIVE